MPKPEKQEEDITDDMFDDVMGESES